MTESCGGSSSVHARPGGFAAVGLLRARCARSSRRSDRPSAALRIPGARAARAWLLATLVLVTSALVPHPAHAIDRQDPRAPATMKTTAHYLNDLSGPEGPDRLFAARVLRSRVKRAVADAARDEAELSTMEARALLDELSRELPGRCAVAMGQEGVVPACADALARIGAVESVPALRVARAAATKRRTVRAIDRALATLDRALPAVPGEPKPERTDEPLPGPLP
jgi:hypothetical protein